MTQYYKDKNTGRVYKQSNLAYVSFAILFFLFLFIIYDWVKDFGRNISGYKNIFSGDATQGAVKLLGFTKGNIIRNVLIYGTFIVFLFISYNIEDIDVNFDSLTEEEKKSIIYV